jgi:hypothetical protein
MGDTTITIPHQAATTDDNRDDRENEVDELNADTVFESISAHLDNAMSCETNNDFDDNLNYALEELRALLGSLAAIRAS